MYHYIVYIYSPNLQTNLVYHIINISQRLRKNMKTRIHWAIFHLTNQNHIFFTSGSNIHSHTPIYVVLLALYFAQNKRSLNRNACSLALHAFVHKQAHNSLFKFYKSFLWYPHLICINVTCWIFYIKIPSIWNNMHHSTVCKHKLGLQWPLMEMKHRHTHTHTRIIYT